MRDPAAAGPVAGIPPEIVASPTPTRGRQPQPDGARRRPLLRTGRGRAHPPAHGPDARRRCRWSRSGRPGLIELYRISPVTASELVIGKVLAFGGLVAGRRLPDDRGTRRRSRRADARQRQARSSRSSPGSSRRPSASRPPARGHLRLRPPGRPAVAPRPARFGLLQRPRPAGHGVRPGGPGRRRPPAGDAHAMALLQDLLLTGSTNAWWQLGALDRHRRHDARPELAAAPAPDVAAMKEGPGHVPVAGALVGVVVRPTGAGRSGRWRG